MAWTGRLHHDRCATWHSHSASGFIDPVVYLSDGRTAEAEFGEVQKIYRHSVVCFGTNYPMVLKPRGEYVSSGSPDYYSPPVSSPPLPVNQAEILAPITSRQLQAPPSTGGFTRQLSQLNRSGYQNQH